VLGIGERKRKNKGKSRRKPVSLAGGTGRETRDGERREFCDDLWLVTFSGREGKFWHRKDFRGREKRGVYSNNHKRGKRERAFM